MTQNFGETCCLQLQGKRIKLAEKANDVEKAEKGWG
jgi:hypothetical protein